MTRSLPFPRTLAGLTVVFSLVLGSAACRAQPHDNVILVTMDGLRWQELFVGMDDTLLGDKENGTQNPDALQRRFSGATPEERRQRLMPFLWNVIAKDGVIFGNPERDSHMRVSNTMFFSYPGYSELLCGFPDPRIDSNDKKNNANVTVLEWLDRRADFDGRIAAVTSWDVFPWIINEERSGIPVNAGWDPVNEFNPSSPELMQLQKLSREIPRYWDGVRYDVFTFAVAEDLLKTKQPRVLYVSLGETDDWAHAARYDLYLDAAQRNDEYIRRLWETAQSVPQYRDHTALVVTTDHGRGDDRISWRSHGDEYPGCDRIWAAVLGPQVDPHTDVKGEFVQASIAATVVSLLGLNYPAEVDTAAAPLPLTFLPEIQRAR